MGHLTVSKKLDREFREVIAGKRPLKKGCIRECTEEAIKEWIAKNKEDDQIGYV